MNRLKHLVEQTGYMKQHLAYEAGMKATEFSKYINLRKKMDKEALLAIREVLLEKGVNRKELDLSLNEAMLRAEDL